VAFGLPVFLWIFLVTERVGKDREAEPGMAASRYNLVCGLIALRLLKMVST
jgi:hypothetical protein